MFQILVFLVVRPWAGHVVLVSLGFPGHKAEIVMVRCLLGSWEEWSDEMHRELFHTVCVHGKHPINISYYRETLLIQ